MLNKAGEEAKRLRQNHIGPEHYLLALIAEPSVATEVMRELGVTHERLAARLGELKTVNGRRPRYRASGWTTVNPAAHEVAAWARGVAAGRGRRRPAPEDWLLAVIYQGANLVASVLDGLGVSLPAVTEALRRQGVWTPDFAPESYRPWRGNHRVEVARSEWQAVVDLLCERHPPGSEWRWGFNSRRDRPGRVQFVAEDGIRLDAIVAEARRSREGSI